MWNLAESNNLRQMPYMLATSSVLSFQLIEQFDGHGCGSKDSLDTLKLWIVHKSEIIMSLHDLMLVSCVTYVSYIDVTRRI